MFATVVPAISLAGSGTSTPNGHRWKFGPTINAPWALEDDENDFDTPESAAGLCRSAPFSGLNAYAPLGANVDVNRRRSAEQQRLLELRLHDGANETTIAVNPLNPNNLIAGANDSYYTRDYGITSAAQVCNVQTNNVASAIPPIPSARSVCMDYAAKSLADNFVAQTRLSTESSNPFVMFADGSFIGDYSQVAIGSDGKAHAAWTDFRGNPGVTSANQDVVVQNYTP